MFLRLQNYLLRGTFVQHWWYMPLISALWKAETAEEVPGKAEAAKDAVEEEIDLVDLMDSIPDIDLMVEGEPGSLDDEAEEKPVKRKVRQTTKKTVAADKPEEKPDAIDGKTQRIPDDIVRLMEELGEDASDSEKEDIGAEQLEEDFDEEDYEEEDFDEEDLEEDFEEEEDYEEAAAEETGEGSRVFPSPGQEQLPSSMVCSIPRLPGISSKLHGFPIAPAIATVSTSCQLNMK